jgi:aldehyde:ferredoxin oxidoreductase
VIFLSLNIGGYTGKFLRVKLGEKKVYNEFFHVSLLRKYIGGTGIGVKILYDEVLPETNWYDSDNRLILASGPLGGTMIGGSGTFSIVTKGPLTNGATSVQANGFFGAYLKFCGFDGIIIQGKSEDWIYIHIKNGEVELRDANELKGKDTFETEDHIREKLGKKSRQISIATIGVAGENLVKFAGVFADKGHSASHNGPGAVLGSKKVKAIVVDRGKNKPLVKDRKKFLIFTKKILENSKYQSPKAKTNRTTFRWGTLPGIVVGKESCNIPVKNYTTSIWDIKNDDLAKFEAEYIRENFKPKWNPCWACQHHHCHFLTITDGKYAGLTIEEPEYEQFAAWGPNINLNDVAATMMLCHETDRLGFENNEAGWLISWIMECYEKELLTKKDLNGLEMTWGNAEATKKMLNMIASREGIGDILAEGIRIASNKIGGEASKLAIYTKKGNTPRGHDHRNRWHEMFDTCVSDTGTIETHFSVLGYYNLLGPYKPMEISTITAKTQGIMQFEDSLGVCRFNTKMNLDLLTKALKAVTGWDINKNEAVNTGKRIVNLLRAFNIRSGQTPDLEYPSTRYGSIPIDGPAKGRDIKKYWDKMLNNYYKLMGWDRNTGKPLPETLEKLELKYVIKDLWS